jgi:alanyl-tRNA synthetase
VRLIKQIASIVDGGGGGKPELATAGGKNIANMDKAMDVARQIFRDI